MLRRAIALLFVSEKCYNHNRIGDYMKNNKGFISMSLVYSFLIVFVAISVSLLAVYTDNITQIRKLNNEIKEELIKKGNERIIVLNNKIKNGSFETLDGHAWDYYWTSSDTNIEEGGACRISNKTPDWDDDLGKYIIGQAFYDQQSIEAKSANCTVSTSAEHNKITMVNGHVYYIERIYNAGNGYAAGQATISFKNGGTVITPTLPHFSSAKALGSGWLLPTSDTQMGTVDVDIFKFTGSNGDYQLVMSFTDSGNNQPFYVDGIMLIDLSESVGDARADQIYTGDARGDRYSYARKIWRIKATKMGATAADIQYTTQGYYEGRKAFSALGPDNIK